mmetsp:Transcript_39654/g.45534  ORF Transcript_39654/g.45534 Transcript_39654/m.45534 type:complete len:169 (-) Transcript_39654:32-538(-)
MKPHFRTQTFSETQCHRSPVTRRKSEFVNKRASDRDLRPLPSREVKSVTRYDHEQAFRSVTDIYGDDKINEANDDAKSSDQSETIQDNQTLMKSKFEGDSMEQPMTVIPQNLESPLIYKKPEKCKLQLYRFTKEMMSGSNLARKIKDKKHRHQSLARDKLEKMHSFKS